MKLSDTLKQAGEKYGTGSNWVSLQQGDNGPFRLLTAPVVIGKHFSVSGYKGICIGKDEGCEGCKEGTKATPKWVAWTSEGTQLKIAEFGYSVIKQLSDLQENQEYAFSDYPMPWTFTIKKTGEKLETEYSIVPARSNSEASNEIISKLMDEKTIEQVIDSMKEKKGVAQSPTKQKYDTDYADHIADSIPF